ncbi:MAG: PTS system mannose/fructose/sorbose family transporter subunit IID [Candidatus Krumholzibacteriota bacterium]|nr:PTS system mannose/fructose/sorbose family transporter subunit IID [Candidatus Krumholzibacteriota bacterium]
MMKDMMRRNIVWRLFFLQNSRNSRILDGLAFFHILLPFFRRISDDKGQLDEIVERHIDYFNSNPIFAPYIAGVVMNLESRMRAGEKIDPERIYRVKNVLSSALTAKGDYFFEIALMPFALTIGCVFAIYSSYIGPMIFLVFYNLYHLKLRIGGYRIGLLLGEDGGGELATTFFGSQKLLGGLGAFVSGVFAALVFARAWSFGGSPFLLWGIAAVPAMYLLRGKVNILWAVLMLFLAAAGFLMIV